MKANLKDIIKYIVKAEYRNRVRNLLKTTALHHESVIDNTKKDVLVIQRINELVGTYSDYIVFLAYIERAIRSGMLPIIDRMSNKNFFLSGNSDENTWEFFFEQPVNIPLNGVNENNYNIHRVYTADINAISLINCHDEFIIKYWREFAKKYIRLNKKTMEHVNSEEEKLLAGKRVLGTALREGYQVCFDSTNIGRDHAFQLDAISMVELVTDRMEKWSCDYVFLTCQSDESLEIFKQNFGDRLIYYDRKRKIVDGKPAHSQRTPEEERQNELDYITEMNLLSKCCCVICSQNSGTEAAFIMSDGFEHFECVNIGKKS